MASRTSALRRLIAVCATALLLSGCGAVDLVTGLFESSPDPTDLTDVRSANYLPTTVTNRQDDDPARLTYPEVVARALAFNLSDRETALLRTLDGNDLSAVTADSLPQLARAAGYVTRADVAAANAPAEAGVASASRSGGEGVLAAQQTWNALDLALADLALADFSRRQLQAALRRQAMANLVQQTEMLYWRAAASDQLAAKLDALEARVTDAVEAVQRRQAASAAVDGGLVRLERRLLAVLFGLASERERQAGYRDGLLALMSREADSPLNFTVPALDALNAPELDLERRQLLALAAQRSPATGGAAPALTVGDEAALLSTSQAQALAVLAAADPDSAALESLRVAQVDVAQEGFRRATDRLRQARLRYDLGQSLTERAGSAAGTAQEREAVRLEAQAEALKAAFDVYGAWADLRAVYARVKDAVGLQALPDDFPVDDLVTVAQQFGVNDRDGADSLAVLAVSLGRGLPPVQAEAGGEPRSARLAVDLGTYEDIGRARQRWASLQRLYPTALRESESELRRLRDDGGDRRDDRVQLLAFVAPGSNLCTRMAAAGDFCLPIAPEGPQTAGQSATSQPQQSQGSTPLETLAPVAADAGSVGSGETARLQPAAADPNRGLDQVTAPPAPAVPSAAAPQQTQSGAAAQAAPASGRVQLAALRGQAEAETAWQRLRARAPQLLAGRQPQFETVDLPQRGRFVRLRLQAEDPNGLCRSLRESAIDCLVVQGVSQPQAQPQAEPAPPVAATQPTPAPSSEGVAVRGPDGRITIVEPGDPCAPFVLRGIACTPPAAGN
ncbi:MAG: hypothetical protein ACTS10_09680 [Kiloniellales bacterium]